MRELQQSKQPRKPTKLKESMKTYFEDFLSTMDIEKLKELQLELRKTKSESRMVYLVRNELTFREQKEEECQKKEITTKTNL